MEEEICFIYLAFGKDGFRWPGDWIRGKSFTLFNDRQRAAMKSEVYPVSLNWHIQHVK